MFFRAKAAALKETPAVEPTPAAVQEEESDGELDIDKQLEEAVEATYKTKSKAKLKDVSEQNDESMDMDDIDQQLEMALEKTKVKLYMICRSEAYLALEKTVYSQTCQLCGGFVDIFSSQIQ